MRLGEIIFVSRKKHRANVNAVFPLLNSNKYIISQDISNIFFISPLESIASKEKLLLLKYVTLTD